MISLFSVPIKYKLHESIIAKWGHMKLYYKLLLLFSF